MDSLKTLGYQFAQSEEATQEIARKVLERCPDFVNVVATDNDKFAELDEGFALRFQELREPVGYSNDWTPIKGKGKPALIATLAWAMSYSPQQLNSLRATEPVMVDIARALHRQWGQYKSARRNALLRAVRKCVEPEKKEKAKPVDFTDYVDNVFSDLKTRCKNAKRLRHDDTADLDKFNNAVSAFMSIWKA